MINRKSIYALAASLALVVTAVTLVRANEPEFPELMSNPRYTELKALNDSLLQQEDSVQHIIAEARAEFSRNRNEQTDIIDIDSFSSYIIALEERIFEIRQQRGDVITELNTIEQAYILAHMYATPEPEPLEESTNTEAEVVAPIFYRSLHKNDIFASGLSAADYAELIEAQQEDAGMEEQCAKYNNAYDAMATTLERYLATNSESEADSLFTLFHEQTKSAEKLSQELDARWNHIIDTKYYAYGYILEKGNHYDALDASSEAFLTMQQQCSELDGLYSSDALMHYVIGRQALLDFEATVAHTLGLSDARDSLVSCRESLPQIEYRHKELSLERRLFIDYTPITIGRTNFYNTTNPLPELKVYERGTIYRILLGTFRTKQPMTLFKGAQPLYIATDEEGNYCYYAGGFETLQEAEEAQLFLKDKGFKRPEICRWRDGIMVNLSAEESSDEGTNVAATGSRYLVMVECDAISDDMRTTITETSPDKIISRRGTQFAIGTFASRSEADILMATLTERYPDTTVSIVELDIQ